MKVLISLCALVLAAGCAEAVHGPRVVIYPDSPNFYVRHLAFFSNTENSNTQVAEIASEVCEKRGQNAELTDEYQFYPFDTKYSVFRCN